jgi:hypothetical protein
MLYVIKGLSSSEFKFQRNVVADVMLYVIKGLSSSELKFQRKIFATDITILDDIPCSSVNRCYVL